eukprot:5796479-Pleurochrysis_carterae.AAC.3
MPVASQNLNTVFHLKTFWVLPDAAKCRQRHKWLQLAQGRVPDIDESAGAYFVLSQALSIISKRIPAPVKLYITLLILAVVPACHFDNIRNLTQSKLQPVQNSTSTVAVMVT